MDMSLYLFDVMCSYIFKDVLYDIGADCTQKNFDLICGSMQDCNISVLLMYPLEILQSCTKPLVYLHMGQVTKLRLSCYLVYLV